MYILNFFELLSAWRAVQAPGSIKSKEVTDRLNAAFGGMSFSRKLRYYRRTMDVGLNFIVGVLAIGYGIYCYIQRKTAPEKIEKLQTMIERNGEKMGHSIHLFGYTIMPIIAGLLLLYAHFRAQ